nr:class I mannose-6-phosphate isomerase [uncultured Sphingomonas sp.]
MTAKRLAIHRVEKPWGRRQLWPGFHDPEPCEGPVGEIWFNAPGDTAPELLIKYLFTSEKLSIQVHPDDVQAHARGLPRGKDECWLVLAADADSTIAMGTRKQVDSERLRAAALDGSIETMVDWKPVRPGDVYYSAAGTIHAIGAGLTLIEIQQNSDTTYRLYDYGRPRELHLEEAIAVADPRPFVRRATPDQIEAGRTILVQGPKFTVERWPSGIKQVSLTEGQTGWLIPIAGGGTADGLSFTAGECLALSGIAQIDADHGSDLLFTYTGDQLVPVTSLSPGQSHEAL